MAKKLLECDNPEYHGNPFRYCVCGWTEDVSEARTNDIENRFAYHAPTPEKVQTHELIRAQAKTLAHYASANLPEGREKALALTKLEEYVFWANAAVARNHD